MGELKRMCAHALVEVTSKPPTIEHPSNKRDEYMTNLETACEVNKRNTFE